MWPENSEGDTPVVALTLIPHRVDPYDGTRLTRFDKSFIKLNSNCKVPVGSPFVDDNQSKLLLLKVLYYCVIGLIMLSSRVGRLNK